MFESSRALAYVPLLNKLGGRSPKARARTAKCSHPGRPNYALLGFRVLFETLAWRLAIALLEFPNIMLIIIQISTASIGNGQVPKAEHRLFSKSNRVPTI